MSQSLIEAILRKHLQPAEDFIYGFADLRGLLDPEYHDFPYGISFAKKLDNDIVDAISGGPTQEYYAHYRGMNQTLEKIAEDICRELEKDSISCKYVSPTVVVGGEEFKPYLKDLRYKFSHKMVGTRSGLGWIGKTDLFVSKAFGPRLRLASILLKEPVIPSARSIDKSRCGNCDDCVALCPAGAANGIPWDIHTDRDLFFDAHKCREQCGKFGKDLFQQEIRICGICVAVCPLGKPSVKKQ